ARVLVYY
ncbi:unnamed protein product, partial [Cuscuta campestris]